MYKAKFRNIMKLLYASLTEEKQVFFLTKAKTAASQNVHKLLEKITTVHMLQNFTPRLFFLHNIQTQQLVRPWEKSIGESISIYFIRVTLLCRHDFCIS